MSNDAIIYQKKLKENIKALINQNRLDVAKELLKKYEEIVKDDIDIYSIKSIIAMMEGDMNQAESILLEGINKNNDDFDLLYNLAYLYKSINQKELAIKYYKTALQNIKSNEDIDDVYKDLQELGIKESKKRILEQLMPKTSIIILTCDNLEYNKLCIESIRQYTEQGTYEIIVVDNNSTDGTVEWLKQQEDIKLILNYENLGFPKGCNQGIKLAEERNDILLLNNDTIVTPNWLKNLKSCLYSDVNIGAVAPVTNNSSYYQAITVNYTNIKEMIEFSETFNIMDTEKWEQRIKLVGYCMLIKRNVVDKIGLLDERFTPGNFEDDDYSIRIQEAGYKLILCKDTFIHHFGSATFENANYNYSKLIERNLKKFEEKWGFNPFYSTIIRDEIIDLIDADRDKKINVLEVGCACGATLLKIKDLYKNANIYGIEFDSVPAKIASNYADIKAEDVENSELSYEKNYFDYIIFADVLEHLYNPDIVLQNMKNYLKNDGKILISIPNIMHFSIIKGLLNQSFEYEDSGILDKTHIRFFTIKDLYKMISKIGYKIDRTVIKEYPQYSEDDDVFMKKLFELNKGSKNIKDWEFRAYQYLLVLKK